MADFVPSNIIQTPNFGELARERINRNRAEETAKNSFIDKFEKANGMYLEGDTPAVQGAWDNVQKTIDMVAENDSPEMRRKLKDVYGEYSRVAGTAQVLADQHRTQVSQYKTDPTKFAMGGSEFFDWDKDYRLQKRNYADMVSSLDNPNVLPSSDAYALVNPYDQAKVLMGDTGSVINSFYDNSGALDEDGLRARIEDVARKKISGSPEAIERAIIWGATTNNNPESGFAGDGDGRINSLEELKMIENLPEEERQQYYDAYVNALVNDYVGLVPNKSAKASSGKKRLSTSFVSLDEYDGEKFEFTTLPSSINGIIQIGRAADNKLFVTVETKQKTNKYDEENNQIEETVVTQRPATELELSKIESKFGNTYDLSALNPIDQEATAEAGSPINPLSLPIFEGPPRPPGYLVSSDAKEQNEEQNEETIPEIDPSAPPIVDSRSSFSQGVDEAVVEEAVVEEAPVENNNEPAPTEEYVVIGGNAYYKKDYEKVAGKRTGKGNYPETFEEYAEAMGIGVMNTKDNPLSQDLDEVTVTAERLDPPVVEEEAAPVQAGTTPEIKEDISVEDIPVIDITKASPALTGDGGPESKHTYKSRKGSIAPAAGWEEGSGIPAPSRNPSSTSAPSYYLKGGIEGTEWTPETVKKAMDRWNNDVPVDPEVFIKAANTFGIPVEFIIALAAKEGGIGVGDRQVRTKNFFNWGNSTKGDKIEPGRKQDKYNKYFETWEDGVMAWADGLVRIYRPDDGDWSKLWADDKSFVAQRSGKGFAKGSRYAESKDQEAKIKEIIDYSFALQFDPKTAKSTTK